MLMGRNIGMKRDAMRLAWRGIYRQRELICLEPPVSSSTALLECREWPRTHDARWRQQADVIDHPEYRSTGLREHYGMHLDVASVRGRDDRRHCSAVTHRQ